ncbi:MAG: HlyD family efflux transporter periplasmic adaptor subunit [Oscillospiraceae bacterium]
MKTDTILKILGVLLPVFLLINVASQILKNVGNPCETETAITYDLDDAVAFKGFFVREERTVTYDGSGVVAYTFENGTKVYKNSPIISIYANADDVKRQQEIETLTQQVDSLTEAQGINPNDVSQLDGITNALNQKSEQLAASIQNGEFSEARTIKNDFITQLNKLSIIKGKAADFNEQIAALNSEIANLEIAMSGKPSFLYSETSGYFMSNCDGYEHIGYEQAQKLTPSELKKLLDGEGINAVDNCVGKLLDDYYFEVAGVFNYSDVSMITEGDKVSLQVELDRTKLEATVKSVSPQENGECVLVFLCDKITKDFFQYRTADVKLIKNTYTGIRIPTDAVRFSDGKKGVFVKTGTMVVFKTIDVIYECDDFVICDPDGDNNQLSLYDEVITKGKDLYDGKSIE